MDELKESKYQQIANQIKSEILQGNFKLDTAIPSELQLQELYSVSRHTVRQGIALLVNEGYLRKEKGSGTFVSNDYLKQTNPTNKVIGVVTTYMSDYIFPAIIRGIEKELSANDYSLLLAITNNDTMQEKKCLEMMLSQNISGLIVEPTQSNRFNPNLNYYINFQSRHVPVLMLNANYDELDIPCVRVDDVSSGYIATNYLLNEGHHNICLVTKIDDKQGKDRMKGYIRAFSEHNIVFDSEDIVTYTTGKRESIFPQLDRLFLNKKRTITGIVCYNDEIALEVIEWLHQKKLKVPKDVSIVSHDNSFLCTASEIKLTSVDHPKEKMGQDIAQRIMKVIETNSELLSDKLYEPKLVVRDSVKKIEETN